MNSRLKIEDLDLTKEFKDNLTLMTTLTMPMLCLWQRVIKNPADVKSYQFTDEEILVIKHTAENFVSGDTSGK